jgi:TRAP-type C4-dicarboxylate transport system substrate-binding protein
VISKSAWDAMSAEQQTAFTTAATAAIDFSQKAHLDREAALVEQFKGAGLAINTPDVDAFRAHAQKVYLDSDLAKDWPEGVVDRINAL